MNATPIRLAVFVLPLLLQSCFTSSALQTAKPLERRTCEFTGGLLGFHRGDAFAGINTMVRLGIGHRSDIGLGYALGLGHLRLDYKYNFYRSADEKRFLSTGIGFEGFFTDFEDNLIPAVNVPLYFSINHTGAVVPYFTQRFTFGLVDPDIAFGNRGEGFHTMFYTGGAGIRYGKSRVKGYVELSYSVDRVRNRHYSYNAADEQLLFDNVSQNAGVELNVGISFTFGGKRR